jgi:hypothetical protein
MPLQVVTGAMMSCTFGAAPSTLNALSAPTTLAGGPPAATIMDNIPVANIPPFGVCTSLANPTVAAATAAALGVLTPMPCVPATAAPWTPGASTTLIGGKPALHQGCTLTCMWGGVISISNPGQTTVQVS